MNKGKITLDTKITNTDFVMETQRMLKVREDFEYIDRYNGVTQPKSMFVKNEYVVTRNRDDFEVGFKADVEYAAQKKIRGTFLAFQILALIAYIAFIIIYPTISGETIEDGWLLIIPFVVVVVRSILNLMGSDALSGFLSVAFVVSGIIFPLLSVLAAVFASEATGAADTACIIAYFIAIIPAIFVPLLMIITLTKSTEEKIKNNPKYIDKYNNGMEEAKKLDEFEADELRQFDEDDYQDHVDRMSKKEAVMEEWKRFETFYENWCSTVSTIKIFCPKVVDNCYGNNDMIERCTWMWSPSMDINSSVYDYLISIEEGARERQAQIERNEAAIDEIATEMSELLSKK